MCIQKIGPLKKALIVGLGVATMVAGLSFFIFPSESIVIESEESKNQELKSVFNEIKWIPGKDQDVWMMNQSHQGRHPDTSSWERLAIVIDKTSTPKTARYYQFKPGPLEWSEDLLQQRTEYRVSCFICHNNGPRAIRPLSQSSLAPLSWKNKLQLAWWNLRIKTYGRIVYDKAHDEEDPSLEVHFRYHGDPHNDSLKIPVCQKCHQEEGLLARGVLKRQQIGTIQHLVNAGHMPPPGFSMSEAEQKKFQDFVRGFE